MSPFVRRGHIINAYLPTLDLSSEGIVTDSYKTYRDTYCITYHISQYVSFVEKVYRYTPTVYQIQKNSWNHLRSNIDGSYISFSTIYFSYIMSQFLLEEESKSTKRESNIFYIYQVQTEAPIHQVVAIGHQSINSLNRYASLC